MLYQLGVPIGDALLAGPSDAGMAEPGQNAAIALNQITAMLLFSRNMKLDNVIQMKILLLLQERAVNGFIKDHREMLRGHAKRTAA